MSMLSIFEDHEYSGEWKLLDSDKSIYGQLRYTLDRAELNLHDAFTPHKGVVSVSDSLPSYPAIHGVSSKGEALSILHAHSAGVGVNIGSGGMSQPERVISSWVIVGAHVEPETLYTSVRFFIPALEVWLSKRVIQHSFDTGGEGGKFTNTFVVRPPDTETTPVPHLNCELEWGVGVTVSSDPFTSIDVTALGWVNIRPESPRTLEWFFNQQNKLAALLAFMAGAPMPVNVIHASVDQLPSPLSVLVTMRISEPCNYSSLDEFFIERGVLGANFAGIVAQWFREVDSVHVPSQLALSVLSTKGLWLHVGFLSLIQALEGFHRGRFHGNYMQDSEYESVKSSLTGAIPSSVAPDHRDALRSRIRYGNQISLSKRLNELRDDIGDALAKVVISSDGKIPRNWIDTRNYLSHWDEELRQSSIDGQAMYDANVRIKHFLRVLYLLMAGVSPETLLQCLGNASRTSQQLDQLNIIARRAEDPSAPPGVLMYIGEADTTSPPAIDEQSGEEK
ncbi:MAG: hypothetical protein P8011_15520 [Acidihalobacter sp.]|uniref:ApeA N-terminal domain 1-containing protein n=1 Tax=Acidihalobacter sp. TaxID=1872108 RepID=UPI00307E4997